MGGSTGWKKDKERKKKNQTVEEPNLLSPLACCLLFLDSGIFSSFSWSVFLDSMGIRGKIHRIPPSTMCFNWTTCSSSGCLFSIDQRVNGRTLC